MSPDLLAEIGKSLYGPLWQSEMARQLGVDKRSVHRWANGEATPRPRHVAALIEKMAERRDILAALRERLEAA